LFIVMEFIPGTDLKSILLKRGRFQPAEAVALMVQACAGVGYAHRAGLVHCDVKPQNLMVTPDQRLKVADFGIARALEAIQPDEKVNIVWGSPQYFSPEQAAGNAPSPASDVYSLGVILYEMLTGQLPFMASSASELARLHRDVQPTPPTRLNPSIPPVLEQIVLKVLSKEPSARYRTADQFGRVLLTASSSFRMGAPARITRTPTSQPSPAAHLPPILPPVSQPQPLQIPGEGQSRENPLDIDWITWGLGLLALLAVGGLIPLWLWIYLRLYPPLP